MVFVPINDHAQKIEQWSDEDTTMEPEKHTEVVRDQNAMMAQGFPFKHM